MEDDDTVKFVGLKMTVDTLVSDCEMVLESDDNNYRLYFKRLGSGFVATAFEFCSCVNPKDIWGCKDLRVRELFTVTAAFDGVRHFGVNRSAGDMAGYIHYPNMGALAEMFIKVQELERIYCEGKL